MQTAQYTAPPLDCPRSGCGALAGEPCRDRSGRQRKRPHAPRLQAATPAKPLSGKQASFIAGLRRELGVVDADMPVTSKQGSYVIKSLIARQAAEKRAAVRVELPVRERSVHRVADGSAA